MMAPYLLDSRALGGPSAVRGIGTYVRGLLGGFSKLGMSDRIELLRSAHSAVPPDIAELGYRVAARGVPNLGRRMQLLADPVLVAIALGLIEPVLYHAVEWGQPIKANLPVVVTVHDLIPFVRKDIFGERHALLRLPALRLLHTADAVIAPSRATAGDILRLTSVAPERLTVIHLATGAHFKPSSGTAVDEMLRALGIRRPFLIAVGTFDPRKRIHALLDVVSRVRREQDLQLVIVGDQGIFLDSIRGGLARARLDNCTRLIPHVPGSVLAALYAASACLVFTSAYEGFGLPPLEAMACGTAVVAFANSSIPEVVGDSAILVPDNDVAAMASAVLGVTTAPAERDRWRTAGLRRAAAFSWQRTAAETMAVYESLSGGPRSG